MKWFPFVGIMLFAAMLLSGCGTAAKEGDTVRVHYTGILDDGTEFDSSVGGEPLEFTIGDGEVIEGFENAIIGMKVGETRTVTIPADQAYPYNEDLVFEVDVLLLPEDTVVGDELYMMQNDGSYVNVKVVAIDEATATIDANPKVAGFDLTFEIELVEIVTVA